MIIFKICRGSASSYVMSECITCHYSTACQLALDTAGVFLASARFGALNDVIFWGNLFPISDSGNNQNRTEIVLPGYSLQP